MNTTTAVAAGAFFGLLGCTAPALLFERALRQGARVSMAAGLASIIVSFVVQSVALLAVYVLAGARVFEFGCAMVSAFLLFWAVEALRAWRAANGHSTGTEERTGRGESSR